MEKKTIGKFIAALRHAGGMTQKELADRLFVSDKTVSRWECDASAPDLSLIPAIAEIFDITADELLRGERNVGASEEREQEEYKQKKSDRQFRTMLRRKMIKFKNLTLISYGIIAAGFLAAAIANFGFTKGRVGFLLALIFFVAAAICQIIFATSARFAPENEDAPHEEELRRANGEITKSTVTVLFSALITTCFLLPLMLIVPGSSYGIELGHFLLYGLLCGGVSFVLVYCLYILGLRPWLLHRGLLWDNEREAIYHVRNRRLLRRTLTAALCALLLPGMCAGILNNVDMCIFVEGHTFERYEDFVAFMEEALMREDDNYSYTVIYPDGAISSENTENYKSDIPMRTIQDAEGNMLCEYPDPDGYIYRMKFSFDKSADGLPLTVYTYEDMHTAHAIRDGINFALIMLAVLDVVICITVYLSLCRKNRL